MLVELLSVIAHHVHALDQYVVNLPAAVFDVREAIAQIDFVSVQQDLRGYFDFAFALGGALDTDLRAHCGACLPDYHNGSEDRSNLHYNRKRHSLT